MKEKELLRMRIMSAKANAKEAMEYLQKAEMAKEMGSMEESAFYHTQAKQELANFDLNHKAINDMLLKIKSTPDPVTGQVKQHDVDHPDAMCWNMIKGDYLDWVSSLRQKVASFTST